MWNIVDKVELVLGKVLRSRHTNPPSESVRDGTTAYSHGSLFWKAVGEPGTGSMRPCGILAEQRGKTRGWKLLYTTKIGRIVYTKEGRRPWSGRRKTGMATHPRRSRATQASAPTPQRRRRPPGKKRDGRKAPPRPSSIYGSPWHSWHASIAISTIWRAKPGSRPIVG